MARLVGQGIFPLITDSNLFLNYFLDLGPTNLFSKGINKQYNELHFPQILMLLELYQNVLLVDTSPPR